MDQKCHGLTGFFWQRELSHLSDDQVRMFLSAVDELDDINIVPGDTSRYRPTGLHFNAVSRDVVMSRSPELTSGPAYAVPASPIHTSSPLPSIKS